ncbi:MAG: hotdog fold thioesterase [Candidatus Lokiarchaeota archaeon]|nr:hotdog fold thioesterase [Candidatus Lokiarchaeota archaeon]MBD3199174.1 hotdog fold thioesterase [Candidatus Lokiarchaeota archaeon]
MMEKKEKKVQERSERVIKLFNAAKGKDIGNFPAIPPFSKWLNGQIIQTKRGLVEIEFKVRPEMANPTGLLHGGMQCGMMDDTIGMTTATLGYEGFPITIDFHVDYLGKVKVGEKVKVVGKIMREGRNILHAISEIYDMNGKLISTGNSNMLRTNFKPDYVKAVDESED